MLLKYRPITINFTQHLISASREILHSCDYTRTIILRTPKGGGAFGVKPEFIARSSTIEVMGCFAITAVLPFTSIPHEYRR